MKRHLLFSFAMSLTLLSCSDDGKSVSSPVSASETAQPTIGAATNSPSAPDREREDDEQQPAADQIGDDCVRFVQTTRAVTTKPGECPVCPSTSETMEVFQFQQMHIDRVSCSETACEVVVTLRLRFNPSKGASITGGLTGWIEAEQKARYANGQIPQSDQIYRVNIAYRRMGGDWRAVEFDRATSESTATPTPTRS